MDTVHDYDKLKDVFTEACQIDDLDARCSFLDHACKGNVKLRQEVESLLEFDARNATVDENAIAFVGASPLQPVDFHKGIPESIGDYKINRLIGEGGMGLVFEAQQRNPQRRVAIKMLRSPIASPMMLARFNNEGQALALLDHPCVAKVFETGMAEVRFGDTARSQPYIVMEYVDGDPLNTFAQHQPMENNIRLFLEICNAVEHAHQRGVVHRDLKPANILVDESGTPRVLDFGIARMTNDDDQIQTVHTRTGQVVGTLPYMSPEQVLEHAEGIDTRSDVYALGVILFELLSGILPYDIDTSSLASAARSIEEAAPKRLINDERYLGRDLETIVLKSLEKDRERRYRSVGAFADDLKRFLNHEPIQARRPSATYVLSRFARRNPLVMVCFAIILVAVITTTTVWRVQLTRAVEAETEANAMAVFLQDLLEGVTPDVAQGADTTIVRGILERAAADVNQTLASYPKSQARIHELIGMIYHAIDEYHLSEHHLQESIALFDKSIGRDAVRTMEARNELAILYIDWHRADLSLPLLRSLVKGRTAALGPTHIDTLGSQINLANQLRRDSESQDEAIRLYRSVLATGIPEHGDEHPYMLNALNGLCNVLMSLKQFDEVLGYRKRIVAIRTRTLGANDTSTLSALGNLGHTLGQLKRFDEAAAHLEDAIERGESIGQLESRSQQTRLYQLGCVYFDSKQMERAATVFAKLTDIRRRTLEDTDSRKWNTMFRLGEAYLFSQQWDLAVTILTEAAAGQRKTLADSVALCNTMGRLSWGLFETGKPDLAIETAREAYAIAISINNENRRLWAGGFLADIYDELERPLDAARIREEMARAARPKNPEP